MTLIKTATRHAEGGLPYQAVSPLCPCPDANSLLAATRPVIMHLILETINSHSTQKAEFIKGSTLFISSLACVSFM